MYQHYREQITACEQEIEKLVVRFQPWVNPAERPLPSDGRRDTVRADRKALSERRASMREWNRTNCSASM
jgi:hypothetical protein